MSDRRKPTHVIVRLEEMFGRTVPNSPESEMALLGAIVLNPDVLSDVREIVPSPGMFYSEAHGAIYEALMALQDIGRGGDLVQLVDRLQGADKLKDVGGVNYLQKLATETPGAAGAMHWARVVREKWTIRRTIEVCGSAIHNAYITQDDPGTVLESLEAGVYDLSAGGKTLNTCSSLADLMQAEFQRVQSREGGVPGLQTGFVDLDRIGATLKPGELTVIAARPSQGKTSLATDIARHIARQGIQVGFFSLEMSRESVTKRIIAAATGVDLQRLIANTLYDSERNDVLAFSEMPPLPIEVDDMGGMSVSQVRSRARRWRQKGVEVIFVDYLQLMREPGRQENRQVEVAAISGGLKTLAKELKLPIVALCQLNRGAENRQDNRPRIGDLRESGAIEQDADCVMLLHREEQYHIGEEHWRLNNQDKIGIGEIIIAKQRNGPTGSVTLKWRAPSATFANFSKAEAPDYVHTGGYAQPIGGDEVIP